MADLIEHFMKGEMSPYFFGTVVLIEFDAPEKWKVVDGQQRMSTTLIFLSVVRDILNDRGNVFEAERINEVIKLDGSPDDDYPFRLKLSKNNDDFFQNHVLTLGDATKKAAIDIGNVSLRNKNLAIAYKTVYNKLKHELTGIPDSNKQSDFLVKMYIHFLKYFVVVKNVIDTPDRAYRLFDSINNRGIALEESDLVKNFLLETIDYENGEVDDWYEKWLVILQRLDGAKIKDGLFLRHFMLAHYGPTDAKKVFQEVSNAITGKAKAENFITNLADAALLYSKLKNPEPSEWFKNQKIVDDLEAFKDLNIKVVYPVLLKGFDIFGRSKQAFSQLVEILLVFFFRSRIICKTSATALEKLMNDLCKKMRDDTSVTVRDIKQMLLESNYYPSDEQFVFDFGTFNANTRNALYILINLNEQMHGGRKTMTLSAEKSRISIEHIMPKAIKGTDWDKYFAKKFDLQNPTARANFHSNYLWRIGNLTILNRAKNFRAQNSPFLKKLDMAYRTDNAKITKHLSKWKEWNGDTISERQKILAKTAKKIWSLNNLQI